VSLVFSCLVLDLISEQMDALNLQKPDLFQLIKLISKVNKIDDQVSHCDTVGTAKSVQKWVFMLLDRVSLAWAQMPVDGAKDIPASQLATCDSVENLFMGH